MVNNQIHSHLLEYNIISYYKIMLFYYLNKNYFPDGIGAKFIGFGNTREQKVESICDKYINEILETITKSFSSNKKSKYYKELILNNNNPLWMPIVSENIYEGNWNNSFNKNSLFSIIKPALINNHKYKTFNWIQLSITWDLLGNIRCESSFNDEWWTEGYNLIKSYAESQKIVNEYLIQKQFIVIKGFNSSE